MSNDELWLRTLALKNDVQITDIKLQQLVHYKNLLLEWNSKINLISRKDEENVWRTHILLSLSYLFKATFPNQAIIADLGTGGGMPGIPLSILCQENSFVLIDSIQKKSNAVEQMIHELHLANAKVLHGRAEELSARAEFKNNFDIVVARSVSNLSNLLQWSSGLLKTKGKELNVLVHGKVLIQSPSLITLKGGEVDEELAKAKLKYPHQKIELYPLVFYGSEQLMNQDKKIVIASK